jgi:putative nucleotidyltransferase with HDIG domain
MVAVTNPGGSNMTPKVVSVPDDPNRQPDAEQARRLAGRLLHDLPERWQHTTGVAQRADELATQLGEDRDLVVTAAWLHDIGYSEAARDTGFHPLDGARYLRDHGWPLRICALVAHHSGSRFVAVARGVQHLLVDFPYEQSPISDAVTYADQTVGPGGRRMDIHERITDMLRRHGDASPNAAVHHLREPYLLAVADRVQQALPSAR